MILQQVLNVLLPLHRCGLRSEWHAVAAVCTMALASGCDAETAAIIANHAAGVVVGKIGTAPIYKNELISALN